METARVRCRVFVRVFLLAAAGLPAAFANAQDELAFRAENYYAMSDLFDKLSFSPGETKTIKSPDPAVFRDFVVPTIDGRLRLGQQNFFYRPTPAANSDQDAARNKVAERMGYAAYEYLGLYALHHMADAVSGEEVSAYFGDTRSHPLVSQFGVQSPAGYLGVLAGNHLKRDRFNQYFCNKDPGCESVYRQMYRQGPQMQAARARAWGRGGNEFVSRAALQAFLSNDKATLVEWSESLSSDIALVGLAELPEYDFGKSGYALRMSMISNGSRRSGDYLYYNIWRPDAPLKIFTDDQITIQGFLAMDAGSAEALTQGLAANKQRNPNGMIFYVLRGKILGVSGNFPSIRGRRYELVYELTDGTVSLYKDASLMEHIGDVALRTQ